MNDLADTTVRSYRGLEIRVQVHRENSKVTKLGTRWSYEVSVEDVQHGTCVCGPLYSGTPYTSRDCAQHAGVQRGRIAIDLLLGMLLTSWR